MGYTGIQMNYYATNKETGVEELFPVGDTKRFFG